jgi:hypothetical protein
VKATFDAAMGIVIATVYWLICSGATPLQVIVVFVVTLMIGSLGFQILAFGIPKVRQTSEASHWLIGPSIGVGLTALFLIRLVSPKELFLALFVVASVVSTTVLVKGIPRRRKVFSISYARSSSLQILESSFAPIGLIGLVLSTVWPWVLPSSVAAGLASILIPLADKVSVQKPLVIGIATGSVIGVHTLSRLLRSELWWLQGDDYQWFEALAHGLVEWGPKENSIAIAGSGLEHAAYHHLAYLFSGLLGYLDLFETYVVVGKVMPVIMAANFLAAITVALAGIQTANTVNATRKHSLGILATMLLCSTVIVDPISSFFGLSAVVGVVAIHLKGSEGSARLGQSVLMFFSLGTLALSKAPYFYSGLIVVTVGAMWGRKRAWGEFAVSVLSAASFVWFFSKSPLSGDYGLKWFSSETLGEFAHGTGIHRALAIMVVFAPVSVGVLTAIQMLQSHHPQKIRNLVLASITVMTIGVISRVLVTGRQESVMYIWEPALFFASLSVAIWMISSSSENSELLKSAKKTAFVVVAIWVYLIPIAIPNLNSGSLIAKVLRFLQDPRSLLIVVTALVLVLAFIVKIKTYLGQQNAVLSGMQAKLTSIEFIGYLTCGAALFSIPTLVIPQYQEVLSGGDNLERVEYLGAGANSDLLSLSDFIRTEFKRNEVIAYSLCDWQMGECPTDYSLAAHTKNRFLSLGGRFVMYFNPSPLVVRDYELSRQIGIQHPAQIIDKLISRGVSLLLINNTSVSPTWVQELEFEFKQADFSNKTYSLWKLLPAINEK